jgi:hypothetical protein
MVIRGKYNFLRGDSLGLAAAVDWRLPTGKEEDLLGSGAHQVKMYLVGALPGKHFSPRASAGYTLSSGGSSFTGELPDELAYSAGFDAALHRRVTLTADFLGRTLLDANRVVTEPQTFRYVFRTDPAVKETSRLTRWRSKATWASTWARPASRSTRSAGCCWSGTCSSRSGAQACQDKVIPDVRDRLQLLKSGGGTHASRGGAFAL